MSVALAAPQVAYSLAAATDPVEGAITWVVVGLGVGLSGWLVLTAYLWAFVRTETSDGFGRLLTATAWGAVPLGALGLFGVVSAVSHRVIATGSVTGMSGVWTRVTEGNTLLAALTLSVVWQGWVLTTAVRTQIGVDERTAREPIVYYVVALVATAWGSLGFR